MHIDKICFIIY